MSDLSRLSEALIKGRKGWSEKLTRERVLEDLLRKRAEAHRLGMADQEAMLRQQIRWALPMLAANDCDD